MKNGQLMTEEEHEKVAIVLYALLRVEGGKGLWSGYDLAVSYFGKSCRQARRARALVGRLADIREGMDEKWSATVEAAGGDSRRPAPCYYDRLRNGMPFITNIGWPEPVARYRRGVKASAERRIGCDGRGLLESGYHSLACYLMGLGEFLEGRYGKADKTAKLAWAAARQAREVMDISLAADGQPPWGYELKKGQTTWPSPWRGW